MFQGCREMAPGLAFLGGHAADQPLQLQCGLGGDCEARGMASRHADLEENAADKEWFVVWNIFYFSIFSKYVPIFSIYLGIIIPLDFHIFQRGGSTTRGSWPMFYPTIRPAFPAKSRANGKLHFVC